MPLALLPLLGLQGSTLTKHCSPLFFSAHTLLLCLLHCMRSASLTARGAYAAAGAATRGINGAHNIYRPLAATALLRLNWRMLARAACRHTALRQQAHSFALRLPPSGRHARQRTHSAIEDRTRGAQAGGCLSASYVRALADGTSLPHSWRACRSVPHAHASLRLHSHSSPPLHACLSLRTLRRL